ncbi:MAG: TonB-dependent receptor [Arhodomonas sp.]|nr:TonB-dependent receptor [Arhodomonas sp.]
MNWQNDLFLGADHLDQASVWIRYDDEVSGTIDYAEDSRDNLAVFAQHQWSPGAFDLQAAVRHDDNEAYGGETTGSLATGYDFAPALHGYASWGTAFKAPTFNDLYYPDTGFFKGNPELDPERSRSLEAGLRGGRDWRWRFAAFHTEVDDLIAYDAGAAASVNVNEARIRGLEGEISTRLAGIDTRLAATWLDTEDRDTGNELPRRPEFSATLGLSRDFGRATLGTEVHYGGERYDDLANTTELDSYTVVDATAAWRINDEWTLRGRLEQPPRRGLPDGGHLRDARPRRARVH